MVWLQEKKNCFIAKGSQVLLDSEEVYACNVCNGGFDTADEVKKHIEINHNNILIQINKTIVEEEESEDDEAFLARFDDDGNLIG